MWRVRIFCTCQRRGFGRSSRGFAAIVLTMTLPIRRPARRIVSALSLAIAALAVSACSTPPAADAVPARLVAAEQLRPISRVRAQLPMRDFQKSFPGGTTVLRLQIDAGGKVQDIRIDQTSGNAALDSAAARSLVGAAFVPYRENGVAVAVATLMPVRFPASGCIMARPLDC